MQANVVQLPTIQARRCRLQSAVNHEPLLSSRKYLNEAVTSSAACTSTSPAAHLLYCTQQQLQWYTCHCTTSNHVSLNHTCLLHAQAVAPLPGLCLALVPTISAYNTPKHTSGWQQGGDPVPQTKAIVQHVSHCSVQLQGPLSRGCMQYSQPGGPHCTAANIQPTTSAPSATTTWRPQLAARLAGRCKPAAHACGGLGVEGGQYTRACCCPTHLRCCLLPALQPGTNYNCTSGAWFYQHSPVPESRAQVLESTSAQGPAGWIHRTYKYSCRFAWSRLATGVLFAAANSECRAPLWSVYIHMCALLPVPWPSLHPWPGLTLALPVTTLHCC
jgi:hypothetical protein